MTRIPFVALVCGIALALSGCVPNPSSQEETVLPTITLSEARTTQNDELARFRQFVSYDILVKDYGTSPPSRAKACNMLESKPINPEDGIFLAGSWRALTPADTNLEQLLSEIRAAYDAKPGWNTRVGDLPNDPLPSTLVIVTSPENYKYYVRVDTEPNGEGLKEVSVSSFSPCVETPDDFDRFTRH